MRSANSAWIVLELALLAGRAQTPATQPNPSQPTTEGQKTTDGRPVQVGLPHRSAKPELEHAAAADQPKSQTGAVGQSIPVVEAPVPVPPGPVPPKAIRPAPPTPIAVQNVELRGDDPWNPEWDVVIEENLPPELLTNGMAKAVRPFCPRFAGMSGTDRRAYWAYFFQALAGAEAGLTPTSDVKHLDPSVAVIDQVTHRTVRQEGLLQLAYWDSERYGCEFDWEKDRALPVKDPRKTILRPKNNLLCGIKILKNQLIDLNEPLLSPNSYWATLRPGTVSYEVFERQMRNVPATCAASGTTRRRPSDKRSVREASTQRPATGAQSSQRPATAAGVAEK